MKRISIVGIVGVPSCYGGFESLVENLLNYHNGIDELTIICSQPAYQKTLSSYKGAKLLYIKMEANGISSIFYDIYSMLISRKQDLILILGVSGCIFLPFFRLFYHGRIITNIDGLEWKRDKWNWLAKKILRYSEKMAVKYSDIIIGDNKGITDYVSKTYKKNAVLIEYGADHAQPVSKEKYQEKYSFVEFSYAITVCRIEPENNIALLIEAYLQKPVDLSFVLVGNWGKSDYGRKLFEKYSKTNTKLILLNPIYDIEQINYLRSNAALYLHGHSAGGTNPSLVEAMNLGLPIFAFDCVYNRETTENKALYWKTTNQLNDLLNSRVDLHQISSDMKEIANRRYQWKTIAQKYFDLFE